MEDLAVEVLGENGAYYKVMLVTLIFTSRCFFDPNISLILVLMGLISIRKHKNMSNVLADMQIVPKCIVVQKIQPV